MSARWKLRQRSERATADKLRSLGCEVHPYGQHLLSDAARELLRDDPGAWERWLPDFLVRTPQGQTVLVDAKFALPGTSNHSIEMRALCAAQHESRPVWYVCSFYDESRDDFFGFKAIDAATVPTTWPCCIYCLTAFHTQIAMLPTHCQTQNPFGTGSRTPFFVVKPDAFPDTDPFGLLVTAPAPVGQPCRVCGGIVLPGGKWVDTHPACHQWPDSGIVYGPPVYDDTVAATGINPLAGS